MNQPGALYIVATPIGNLEDITLRALRILKEADIVACEDTRVTSKLLTYYEVSKPLLSLHHHSGKNQFEKILEHLTGGKNVAYVSDAGTPGVSDPGNALVEKAIEKNIPVVPVPGASALATLISVSGIDMQSFVFLGFPPHKKGRETFFRKVALEKMPVIYYDSPHRVLKNIELLKKMIQEEGEVSELAAGVFGKHIIIGRELTKMFEEIIRGGIDEILRYFAEHPDKIKGEFVVIVY